MIPYKIQKWFKKGVRVNLYLTFRCNLKCEYCSIDWYHSRRPVSVSAELNFEGWKRVIDNLGLQEVKEFVITGGEPSIHKDIGKIVQYLLDLGKFVIINTNLLLAINKLPLPHKRLMFYISFHNSAMETKQQLHWIIIYKQLKRRGYRLRVDRVGKDKKIQSKKDGYKRCYNRPNLIISPGGKKYFDLEQMIKGDTK